jgi:uncharacterized protein YraI
MHDLGIELSAFPREFSNRECGMIKKLTVIAGAALMALTMAPTAASASSTGYVTTNLNVRAGPGVQYPAVSVFPPGARVNIIGCTRGFGWCDVSARGVRGWVSGSYLDIRHQNRRGRAPAVGAQIGLPIISFSIGSYWDNHYRGRSWYNQRSRFGGTPPRAAPRQTAPRRTAPSPPREWRREDRRGRNWDGRRGDRR